MVSQSIHLEPDHPRIRGEHGHHHRHRLQAMGIIPAYAGSTSLREMIWLALWDHPRIRGEHPDAERHDPKGNGSSPHTRGAPLRALPRHVQHGIIPAYAGSTILAVAPGTVGQDHPRIRGEH